MHNIFKKRQAFLQTFEISGVMGLRFLSFSFFDKIFKFQIKVGYYGHLQVLRVESYHSIDFKKSAYRTRALITRGLYTFYPIFEGQKHFLSMVSIQERFQIKSGL